MAIASVAKALVFLAKPVALAFAVPLAARGNGLVDIDVDTGGTTAARAAGPIKL